jgi:hypothetical protein
MFAERPKTQVRVPIRRMQQHDARRGDVANPHRFPKRQPACIEFVELEAFPAGQVGGDRGEHARRRQAKDHDEARPNDFDLQAQEVACRGDEGAVALVVAGIVSRTCLALA